MADEKTEIETNEEAEAAAFDTASATETAPQAQPVETKTDKADADVAPPAEGASAPAPAVQDPPAEEHVQLTKAQYDRLMAAAEKSDGFEAKFDKLFGSVGGVQQIVKDLQAATPKGLTVEIPEDAVAEMAVDYPELAGHFRKALEKALKGVKGTSSDAPAAAVKADPEEISRIVKADFQRNQALALEDEHPGWRQIVGVVDQDGKYDAKQPFRVWLASQPAAYQARINGTDSASVIAKAIDRFKADTAKKPAATPHANVRKDRIKDAVQPRGAGGVAPGTGTTEDDGFNSVKIPG